MRDRYVDRKFWPLLALGALVGIALALSGVDGVPVASAANFTVNTTADGSGTCDSYVPNVADCTLREAITAASAGDTVDVPAGTYTITLPGVNEELNAGGDLDIAKNLTIAGAGANATIIDAGQIDRAFHIRSGTVTISGVAVRGGDIDGDYGGGIYNSGTLTLNSSSVSGNRARGYNPLGGGIYNRGTLKLTNTTVNGNVASGLNRMEGGGIYNDGGSVTLDDSTVADNNTRIGGGILSYGGTLSLNRSTVSGNTAEGVGGIYTLGTTTLNNSTVSGNSDFNGAGIYNVGGTLTLNSSTVSEHTSSNVGAGIRSFSPATLTMRNSIVANNAPQDCDVPPLTFTSLGHNLDGDGTCNLNTVLDDLPNIPAWLAPLANYGGPTETHALCTAAQAPDSSCGAASPGIDAAGNAGCPATDQRGVPRPQPLGGACDIGAYEAENSLPLATVSSAGEYCISGESTGAGWSWSIVFLTNDLSVGTYRGTVPAGLPVGSPPSVIASAWGDNIALHQELSVVVSQSCFKVSLLPAANALFAPSGFALVVNPDLANQCLVTSNPSGCSFNPTVLYVPPVGGTVALSVTAAGSPRPWLQLAAGAAATLVALVAGGWYAMWRFERG